MTSFEREHRNRDIVRSRLRGFSEAAVASLYEISERQVRRIMSDYRADTPALGDIDPLALVGDMVAAHDAATDEVIALADQTSHDAVKLGALRTRLVLFRSKLDLLQFAGLFPAESAAFRVQVDLNDVGQQIADVFTRHQLPNAVVDDVLSVLEGQSPGDARGTQRLAPRPTTLDLALSDN